jgi:GNAT superfamily N-acetyltransferase
VTLELTRDDGYAISDDPTRIDLDRCHAWLDSSYWAAGRSRDVVEKSFANSRVFGAYAPDGAQVALTRVVTDAATFAWVCDVFVDESVRGLGIGTWLVGAAVEAVRGEGVQRFILGTRDAHGVYEKVGFRSPLVPEVYMERDERPTRPQPADVDLEFVRAKFAR